MVNFNNFQINGKPSQSPQIRQEHFPYPFSLVQKTLPCDMFQKSTQVKNINTSEQINLNNKPWDKERLEKIYDEVWQSVIKNVPETEELSIEKPVFVFDDAPESKSAQAAYNFINNTVECNSNNLEDYFLHAEKDKNGEIQKLISVLNESSSKETFPFDKKDFPNAESIKLTDKEKELYMHGAFAHELRHCIQEHLMASTKGVSKTHRKIYKQIRKDIEKGLEDITLSELDENLKKQFDTSYSKNYCPKKLLDKDMKLKFSMAKSDSRCISIKKHFLKDALDDMQHKAYESSPVEMDANNFAFEYLTRYVKSFDELNIPDIRKEILLGIISEFDKNAQYALNTMEQYGFTPLIKNTP